MEDYELFILGMFSSTILFFWMFSFFYFMDKLRLSNLLKNSIPKPQGQDTQVQPHIHEVEPVKPSTVPAVKEVKTRKEWNIFKKKDASYFDESGVLITPNMNTEGQTSANSNRLTPILDSDTTATLTKQEEPELVKDSSTVVSVPIKNSIGEQELNSIKAYCRTCGKTVQVLNASYRDITGKTGTKRFMNGECIICGQKVHAFVKKG